MNPSRKSDKRPPANLHCFSANVTNSGNYVYKIADSVAPDHDYTVMLSPDNDPSDASTSSIFYVRHGSTGTASSTGAASSTTSKGTSVSSQNQASMSASGSASASSTSSSSSSSQGRTIGLGVGIGLGVALLVLVTVLICLFMSKRRKSMKKPSLQGENSGPPATTTLQHSVLPAAQSQNSVTCDSRAVHETTSGNSTLEWIRSNSQYHEASSSNPRTDGSHDGRLHVPAGSVISGVTSPSLPGYHEAIDHPSLQGKRRDPQHVETNYHAW